MKFKVAALFLLGILFILDYFRNRGNKQIETLSISYESMIFIVPLFMAINNKDNTIEIINNIAIIEIIAYLLKSYIVGVRIFYVDIKKEEVINTIKIYFNNQISSFEENKSTKLVMNDHTKIYLTQNKLIIIKSGINIIKSYKWRKQISSRLGELDNHKNKSYIDLILGALVIVMGIAL